MIESLTQFFSSLPSTSQAAIIASLVTVVGGTFTALIAFISVYLTHRGNEKRFAKQLKHDVDQKRTEREMTLRKEIYLDAADAVVAGLDVLGRYANLNMPDGELNANYAAKRGAMAKVHLIGGKETVNAILAFTIRLDQAMLNLALLRMPLIEMQGQIKLLEGQIAVFGKERDRMVELMKQLNFEGNKDPTRWSFVNETFEFEQRRIQEAIETQKSISIKLGSDWVRFAADCIAASTSVSELLVPAVKAIRSELELPFDESNYCQMVEESIRRQKEMVRQFQERMEQSLKSRFA